MANAKQEHSTAMNWLHSIRDDGDYEMIVCEIDAVKIVRKTTPADAVVIVYEERMRGK